LIIRLSRFQNPEGILAFSPGLRGPVRHSAKHGGGTRYPGRMSVMSFSTPKEVESSIFQRQSLHRYEIEFDERCVWD
jgi:hypothetical protein